MKIPKGKVFLVGGSVRDLLLGIPAQDRDYVVVGMTSREMIDLGFLPVEASFPVFLDPETREEYALARKEKKEKSGYHGFSVETNNVTLSEDLRRRDLTINAIAMDPWSKEIFDPYNGKKDLEKKILRHVSPAFSEDPLRVLRVARFNSKFSDFSIDSSTLSLMKKLVLSGELNSLPKERFLLELKKALNTQNPSIFFSILESLGVDLGFDCSFGKNILKSISFESFIIKAELNNVDIVGLPLSNEDIFLKELVNFEPDLTSLNPEGLLKLFKKIKLFNDHKNVRYLYLLSQEIRFSSDKVISLFMNSKEIDKSLLVGFSGKEYGEQLDKLRLEKIKKNI